MLRDLFSAQEMMTWGANGFFMAIKPFAPVLIIGVICYLAYVALKDSGFIR